ncbi:MAG TPA: response regulator [Deltaproteobacteria bacterium]|nr:response regulator [Deltaproteobacteria bacterium]
MTAGLLFVDDEPENVSLAAEILAESLKIPVMVADSVERAVELLHTHRYQAVIMDLFIPLGDHPDRILGPRARRYQENVDHLGGLVLLEEIHRLEDPPLIISHTACTDPVLHELFGDSVVRMIPKPAPLDTLLTTLREALEDA